MDRPWKAKSWCLGLRTLFSCGGASSRYRTRQANRILAVWLVAVAPAVADHQSLWELGFGAGVARIPYYRGASQDHQYVLPVPVFVYRGERVRAGDGGIEGILLRSDRAKLDFSLAAGLPARSDEDGPRAGMPRLNATFEVGPSLELNVWRPKDGTNALWMIFPLRAALSFDDLDVRTIGGVFAPYLESVNMYGDWRVSLTVGPIFGTENYHGYFYDVEPQYVTSTRPAYDAPGGYSGMRFGVGLRQRTGKRWMRLYLRYDYLRGARFEDSPLVEQDSYLAAGIALTWQVWNSSKPAEHVDSPLDPRTR